MSKTALEYAKFVLERVSFDRALFEKEFSKALIHLGSNDARELRQWVDSRFRKKENYR